MNKYKNYIFLSICEETIKRFKLTSYQSYTVYCKSFTYAFNDGKLNSRELIDLEQVYKVISIIYSITYDEFAKMVDEFFSLPTEDLVVFEKAVRMTDEYFVTGV